jgi:hypothetical protein
MIPEPVSLALQRFDLVCAGVMHIPDEAGNPNVS